MNTDFDSALAAFIEAAQKMINGHHVQAGNVGTPPVLETDPRGVKYVRVVRKETFGAGRSVYCFVEKSTGDILKAASWKAPALGVRGNIYADNPIAGVTPYGAVYNC